MPTKMIHHRAWKWAKRRLPTDARGWIAETLLALRDRSWTFFYRRCLVGFPWFWAAQPPGMPVMVAARRMVRQHFGCDRHRLYRGLAQVLAAVAWPTAVFVYLCEIHCLGGAKRVSIRRIPGAFWAAMRHNVLPGEYYAYAIE